MNEPYVTYASKNNIGVIEFYTPQHNSLPAAILEQLATTIKAAGEDEKSNVLILQSGGNRTFCAGASFDELTQITNETEGLQFFSGFANVINAMRLCPKLIVGRIQGKAIGGGVGLASSCDYCLATTEASIKLSELAIGIGPFVVGPAVERKIGVTAAYEMAIDAAEFRSAEWAHAKGLYVHIYESIELLDKAVLQLAVTLAEYSPDAMRALKQVFWNGTEHWNDLLLERAAISGKLILSDYSKNFIAEFKRK